MAHDDARITTSIRRSRSVREHAADHLDRAIAMRRRLHEWPEIGNELPRTRDEVLASIEDLPLDVTLHSTRRAA